MVEQLTLNQWVLGSSPRRCTRASIEVHAGCASMGETRTIRPVGQAVKTAASHAANGSSILPRVTNPFGRKGEAREYGEGSERSDEIEVGAD